MQLLVFAAVLVFTIHPATSSTQPSSMFGIWKEPMGSMIRIERCPSGICLRLINLSPGAPVSTDVHNPNPTLRHRPLCGLEIGSRFHLTDPTRASGGTLYDPKSGSTYRGAIMADGDVLKLRGYVGMPVFGRTEEWRRITGDVPSCAGARPH